MKITNKVKKEGTLDLNGVFIPCYVLEDGTRVLSASQMQDALHLFPEKTVIKSGTRLARLLNSKAINELIVNRYGGGHFTPIICFNGQTKINGYEATLLADLCDIMLEARREKILNSARQEAIAQQCEVLMRSFAKVGIIALIDEATGYQYDREKYELQAILKLLVSPEILEWQKTFHLGFYKELFRLWGIPFTAKNISRKPPFIGTLTSEFVYKNLPKGSFVLETLKAKTPKTDAGNYKVRLFQSLTPFGKEELKKVIYTVESLANISENKEQLKKLLQQRYKQHGIQQKLFEIPDIKQIDKAAETEPAKLSDLNEKLKTALNYNPKEDNKK